MRTCIELEDGWIKLQQRGKDNFCVVYGKQIDDNLNYASAAAKFGQAVMHHLACEGKLDNRERNER